MKHTMFLLATLLVLQFQALAKRTVAPIVTPVVHDGVQYIAPNNSGIRNYIRAVDLKTGKTLWEKIIFEVQIKPLLEADIQLFFIVSIQIKDTTLLITDEHTNCYILDLKTKKVTKMKNNEKTNHCK